MAAPSAPSGAQQGAALAQVRARLATIAVGVLLETSGMGCVPRERHEKPEPAASAASEPASDEAEVSEPPTTARSADEPGAPPSPASASSKSAAETRDADPVLTSPFKDDFNRSSLGPDWRATSAAWTLEDGRLCGENARNHPVWLARRLPLNAVIEFEASSSSPDGDIKAEYWGDGRSSASGQSYTDATSYLTVFGGWKNRFHVLARLDEHGRDRREIKLEPGGADFIHQTVVPHQVYQFQVERRDGRTLRWLVDDMEIATYPDAEPLAGPGHEHFGFNDWQVRVCFDNLRVTPLRD